MARPDLPGAFMPMPGQVGFMAGSVPGLGLATRWWSTAAALVRRFAPWLRAAWVSLPGLVPGLLWSRGLVGKIRVKWAYS